MPGPQYTPINYFEDDVPNTISVNYLPDECQHLYKKLLYTLDRDDKINYDEALYFRKNILKTAHCDYVRDFGAVRLTFEDANVPTWAIRQKMMFYNNGIRRELRNSLNFHNRVNYEYGVCKRRLWQTYASIIHSE
jgi:hypothetical protein